MSSEPVILEPFDILKLQSDELIIYISSNWRYQGEYASIDPTSLQNKIVEFINDSKLSKPNESTLVQGPQYHAPLVVPKEYLDTSQLTNLLKNTGVIKYTAVISAPLTYDDSINKWSASSGFLDTEDTSADDVVNYFLDSNVLISLDESGMKLRVLFELDKAEKGEIMDIDNTYDLNDVMDTGLLYSYNIFDLLQKEIIYTEAESTFWFFNLDKVDSVRFNTLNMTFLATYLVEGLTKLGVFAIDDSKKVTKGVNFVEKPEVSILFDSTGVVDLTTVSVSSPFKNDAHLKFSDTDVVHKSISGVIESFTVGIGFDLPHYWRFALGSDEAAKDPFAFGIMEIVEALISNGLVITTAGALSLNHLSRAKIYLSDSITIADKVMDMHNSALKNLGTPVDGNDAVTKKYVDDVLSQVQGLARVQALETQLKQLYGRLFKLDPNSVAASHL